jgi:hypothetical protein
MAFLVISMMRSWTSGYPFIQERISSVVAIMNAVCGSNLCRSILPSIPVDVTFEQLRE